MFAVALSVNTHSCATPHPDVLQIKYLRVPDEIVDVVKEQQVKDQANRGGRGGMHQRGEHRGDRGGRGMRGRGRGRGRGGGGGA
jgi:U6 snRNA-associated Sm-like protein LSm4